MPLTDTAIKALKPRASRYTVTDEKGLVLEVYPTGGMLWHFRYRLNGAESVQVKIGNRRTGDVHAVELKKLTTGKWAEAVVDFAESKPKSGERVDEITFVLPKGADLLVDDVLLYAPGEK